MLVIAILVVGAYLEGLIERAVLRETGLKISLEKIELHFLRPGVTIHSLHIYNPAGFPDEPLAVLPKALIRIRLNTLLTDTLRFSEIRLNFSRVNLMKNSNDVLNVDAVANRLASKSSPEPEGGSASPKKSIHIERLHLSLGTIRYRELKPGGQDVSVDAKIVDKEYRDVKNVKELATTVIIEILKSAMVDNALKAILASPLATLGGGGRKIIDNARDAVRAVRDKLKDLFRR